MKEIILSAKTNQRGYDYFCLAQSKHAKLHKERKPIFSNGTFLDEKLDAIFSLQQCIIFCEKPVSHDFEEGQA